jgi:hypothetical protein
VNPSTPQQSRAALRLVEAGSSVNCAFCGERIKYSAKERQVQVIANVYVDGAWDRVEHYHDHCYHSAGNPYGDATVPPRLSRPA